MNLRRYTCRTVRNMLPLHVGGDLDPRHAPDVDRHLKSCLVCFREFRELASMRGRLGVLAEEPLPAGILDGFTEEVMARIEVGEPGPEAEAPHPGPGQRVLSFQRLSAAAAVLIVALAGWRALNDQGLLGQGERDRAELSGTVADGAQTLRRRFLPVLPTSPRGGSQLVIDGGSSNGLPTGQDAADDLLGSTCPPGMPFESQVEAILRTMTGQLGQRLHGHATSGLQRDEGRSPRRRDP